MPLFYAPREGEMPRAGSLKAERDPHQKLRTFTKSKWLQPQGEKNHPPEEGMAESAPPFPTMGK